MELAKIFQVMQTIEMWGTPFLTGLGVESPVALLLGSPTNWVKVLRELVCTLESPGGGVEGGFQKLLMYFSHPQRL